ncbi:MAG: hypothetical protein IID58_10835 [Proteobacteria bacterium]|nr:hypothetical protein [Pseudomonadota bacterium]
MRHSPGKIRWRIIASAEPINTTWTEYWSIAVIGVESLQVWIFCIGCDGQRLD